jgi:NitT/TauT family transport system ATP-binding protein
MVFQDGAVFPWLTALENVCYGPRVRGIARQQREAKAHEVLGAVGLAGFEGHYPRQLSGGMRQRVAIARSLANEPRLLLMDEPFGALDAQTRVTLQDLLLTVRQSYRGTVLFVTHDVDEAILLGDRVVVLSERPGRVVLDLSIDMPRPRSSDVTLEERFLAIKRRVRGALRHGPAIDNQLSPPACPSVTSDRGSQP